MVCFSVYSSMRSTTSIVFLGRFISWISSSGLEEKKVSMSCVVAEWVLFAVLVVVVSCLTSALISCFTFALAASSWAWSTVSTFFFNE